MLIRIPKGWEMPEREATPESVYLNRRKILKAAGFLGAGSLLARGAQPGSPLTAVRNPEFTLDRPITDERAATGFNNFYEFDQSNKSNVKNLVGRFVTHPWKVEVGGLVAKPRTFDADDLAKMLPLEERLYRFRCVERWAMAVPWIGAPFSELAKLVEPKPEAKFVRFTSAARANEMPGVANYTWYKWPYYEGHRIEELMNPLAMIVVGLYGKTLPKQNGAPIRLIVPWKYGYKSPKSLVKIEFVARQPHTFWNDSVPAEYGFYSNINPGRPHPRWSQEIEELIPTGEKRKTQIYNGYGKWVAGLYNGKEV